MSKKPKALILFSGGLNSVLSTRLLQEQDLSLKGLFFSSCFFKNEQTKKAAQNIGLDLDIEDITEDQLTFLNENKSIYPEKEYEEFIVFLLQKARQRMIDGDFDFIVTGENFNHRLNNKTKKRMKSVEKKAYLQGFLLRPLSAKKIQITIPEKKGWVDRGRLKGFFKRVKKSQQKLIEEFDLTFTKDWSDPLLIDNNKFKSLLDELCKKSSSDIQESDVELLKVGHHYWYGKAKIVFNKEKETLQELADKNDKIIDLEGQSALIRSYRKSGNIGKRDVNKAKKIHQEEFLS